MSVVVQHSAREMFTPRELVDAYKEFTEHGAQYQDAETGLSASAYCFGERVLLVYEEPEAGVVVLTHLRSENLSSPKFARYTREPGVNIIQWAYVYIGVRL